MKDLGDTRCVGPQDVDCFLPEQQVDIDNCWLAVGKDDLEFSEGVLEIVAYNQAFLTASTAFKVQPRSFVPFSRTVKKYMFTV